MLSSVMYTFGKCYVLLTVHLDIMVQKNQLDAQLILSTFRQPLYVSSVTRPIIRRQTSFEV